jgi:hypothetical protein
MLGIRVNRIEIDDVWSFVGKKQKRVERHGAFAKGDQLYRAGRNAEGHHHYRIGKRDSHNTDKFVQDLRGRVLGAPEISTDGFHPCQLSVSDAFRNSAHGDRKDVGGNRSDAAHRYSPCAVIAVSREVMAGVPAEISTSYVERANFSIHMGSRRFTRLTNGLSKKLECHAAAVSLHVAHYNSCRVHETLNTTPAIAIGVADRPCSVGDLLDAILAIAPPAPTETAPDQWRRFRVIQGGKSD